jgi:thiamine monophosphate kinase
VPPAQKDAVEAALADLGIPFAFIGRVIEGMGVHLLRDGEREHYTEVRCEEDELARMWALYPRIS